MGESSTETSELRGATASAGFVVRGALGELDALIRELQARRDFKIVYVRVGLGRLKIVTESGP